MNKQILETLTLGYQMDQCKLANEKDLRSARPTSFTALISGVSGVFNLFTGTIDFIGLVDGLKSVNIRVNDHELIRYLNLDSTDWSITSKIGNEVKIGTVARNKMLGIEYCTQWQGTSKFPVRIQGRTWYKQNPIDILDGIYEPPQQIGVVDGYTPKDDTYEFSVDERSEWQPTAAEFREEVEEATKEEELRIKAALQATKSG